MAVVSFAVQGSPRRSLSAAALADRIDGEVVWDPQPDSPIRSPWRTFRALLEATPADATHRFQVQDDATPCPSLRRAVENAVAARPDRLLVFFVAGRPRPHAQAVLDACQQDRRWAELAHTHWCPAVCTCWPVDLIDPFLSWVDEQRWPEKFCADDEIVGRWLRHSGHRAVATVPSLVEHRDDVMSLIGLRNRHGSDPGRVAACWIGDCPSCEDPAEVDWTVREEPRRASAAAEPRQGRLVAAGEV